MYTSAIIGYMSQTTLFSIAIALTGLTSILHFARIKADGALNSEYVQALRHWGFALGFLALAHTPTLAIHLGIGSVIDSSKFPLIQTIYIFALFSSITANLLFLRGIFLLQKKAHFWKNDALLIGALVLIAVLVIPFLLLGNKTVPVLMTLYIFGFQIPIRLYIAKGLLQLRGEVEGGVLQEDFLSWRLHGFFSPYWILFSGGKYCTFPMIFGLQK